MATPVERIVALEGKMDRVEEGIANFRDFQSDARDFFSRADERAKTEKEFHNRRDAEIKEAMEARHQENADKLNLIESQIGKKTLLWTAAGVTLTLAGLVIAVLSIWVAVKLAHVGDLRQLFLHSNVPALYAEQKGTQSAGGSMMPAH